MMTKDKQNEVEILAQFINKLTTETFELDDEIKEIIDDNFWDLL